MEDVMKQVTKIEEIASYSNGAVIELPDFGPGMPFVAKLKRPSILIMAKSGKIPNSLMVSAANLFMTGSVNLKEQDKVLAETHDVVMLLAEASLVEPTLAELREAGVELTDEQLMAIFNYTQMGVRGLSSFRKE